MSSPGMKESVDELTTKKIFIVGGNKLQNELITTALEEETGFSCMVVEDLAQIRCSLQTQEGSECLALYDCLGKEAGACIADLEQNWNDGNLMLGLFNLSKGQGLEKDAFACGVRAFFYRGEPFNILLKGIVGSSKASTGYRAGCSPNGSPSKAPPCSPPSGSSPMQRRRCSRSWPTASATKRSPTPCA